MNPWPKHPLIYEINTWPWLFELSAKKQGSFTLANIPEEEWDELCQLRPDAIWLMGVWERSPAGRSIALANPTLVAEFQRCLPDFGPEDVVGSAYCIRQYQVDARLGGPEGLAAAREQLAKRNVRLILDYVPNHVAPDHPWATEHPEYFIQGDANDLEANPNAFRRVNDRVLACGKDPYFPAWPDVLQLNAFDHGLRLAALDVVSRIASQCDGMRCDMAMLMMNPVFERTWGGRAGPRPQEEYWPELIAQVKRKHPDVLFIAEAYWDMEWELQQQGFDYCYDKRLYDRLAHGDAESVRLHLLASLDFQEKLVRFIENHDEPRAAAIFPPAKERAAAIVAATLPGAKLLHEGQLEGRKTRLPVFLRGRPEEPVDNEIRAFYQRLLRAINVEAIRNGEWRYCERAGWPDNQTCLNIASWCWRKGEDFRLIVLNLSSLRSQALISLPWVQLAGRRWRLHDSLSGLVFEREGNEMLDPGLYIDLEGWGAHFLEFRTL